MPIASPQEVPFIQEALSDARMVGFLAAANGDAAKAMALYGWNARVSSALMLPAHFVEVVMRNAVSDVLAEVHGERWVWNPGFERSLSDSASRYGARAALVSARRGKHDVPAVVPELPFAFWQHLFSSRHEDRLWRTGIRAAFPNRCAGEYGSVRARVHRDLDAVRRLRNRIAHHEPIHDRDLDVELARMIGLIELRCASTAAWVHEMEDVTTVLGERTHP